jgi:DnaJ-class molecular chaperone
MMAVACHKCNGEGGKGVSKDGVAYYEMCLFCKGSGQFFINAGTKGCIVIEREADKAQMEWYE